ncbi:MAG TPA: hypothetical protein VK752_32205 [Bryobacteraceae bacterium]|jgi:hypothetical protein|nr:hypothetical protein [Bryobacteraceae bacterium]
MALSRSNWPGVMILGMMVCVFGFGWLRKHIHPAIKIVYLVPSDVTPRPNFEEGSRRALVAAQLWYFNDLGKGVTFGLANPLVETVRLAHPEKWYRARAAARTDRETLWQVTLDEEAFAMTGGSYDHARYTWVYFLDANLPEIPSQGTDGVALLLRSDIINMLGRQPSCWTVGGIAHELGHAYGLQHPADCDSHRIPDADPACASMSYLGGDRFPHSAFLASDREMLLRNRAFVPMKPEAAQIECTMTKTQTPQQ